MKGHCYLTINKSGIVKMTKEKPSLSPTQRAVHLTVSLPDSAFEQPPILDAELNLPTSALAFPTQDAPVDVEIWRP